MVFINRSSIFAGAARSWCLLLLCIQGLALLPALGQNAPPDKLSGRVVNETGAAITGATVSVNGGQLQTSTNASGEFTLDASADSLWLAVSHIGYTTRQIWLHRGQATLILLQSARLSMDTVQITLSTGYQEIPRERATGSFSQISGKQLSEQVSTSLLERLEAVTGSVATDRSTQTASSLIIRGLSTLQGVRGPLIVVDNFPYEGSLDNLNPNDVESITILKDAAAASIWGARAANGVIVITSKKAKYNQPVKVEFSSAASIISPPDLFKKPSLSSSEMIDIELFLYGKGFFNSQITSASHPALSPVVEILAAKAAGKITATAADDQINALRSLDVRNDFNRYMYNEGLNQQYFLSVRGGSKDVSWLFSSGYDRTRSVLSAGYDRLNLRLNNSWRPFKNLQAGAGISFTGSKQSSGKPGFGDVTTTSTLPLYTRFADDQGNALPVMKAYALSYLSTAGNGKLLDWNYYPLTDYSHNTTATGLQEMVGNLNLNYRIIGSLNIDLKYQYQYQQSNAELMQDQDSYYTRDLVNRFTQLNATGPVTYKIPPGAILDRTNSKVLAHNVRGQLNFSQTWGKHSVTAIAGSEVRDVEGNGQKSRIYGLDTENYSNVSVDFANTYPLLVGPSPGFIPGDATEDGTTNRFISAYANAAWTYLDRYTLSASGRRDASNLFGVSTNDKWTPLWSAGAAWEVSSEPFYKFAPVPYLKLRTTYGFSGNTDPSRSAVTTLSISSGASPYTLVPAGRIFQFANADLKWERIKTVNFGIDFATAGRRISGSIEAYLKRGYDLFGTEVIDYTGGAGATIVKNTAKIKGSGMDFELQSLNTTGAIKWSTRLNLSTIKDEVIDYYLSSNRGSDFVQNTRISGLPGTPIYSIFSYRWAGLDPATGDPMGIVDGKPSKIYTAITGAASTIQDLKFHGSALPRVLASMGNTVAAGPFSVSAAIVGKMGHYFHKDPFLYSSSFNRSSHIDYANRWQKPGDEQFTNVPSLVYPAVSARDAVYAHSEVNVLKGDHIRLQYVTAAWEITRKNWKALPTERLSISLNATNLGLLWTANKEGLDPEYPDGAPLKTYSLTLKTSL